MQGDDRAPERCFFCGDDAYIVLASERYVCAGCFVLPARPVAPVRPKAA